MGRIAKNNQDGNYLVEIFGPQRRVDHFQSATREDAIEETWQRFRSRQNSTARITTRITICRIWQPRNGHGWKVTDAENITREMFDRWHQIWANPTSR